MVPQCHLSNHGLFDTPRAFSHFSTRCCYLGRLTGVFHRKHMWTRPRRPAAHQRHIQSTLHSAPGKTASVSGYAEHILPRCFYIKQVTERRARSRPC